MFRFIVLFTFLWFASSCTLQGEFLSESRLVYGLVEKNTVIVDLNEGEIEVVKVENDNIIPLPENSRGKKREEIKPIRLDFSNESSDLSDESKKILLDLILNYKDESFIVLGVSNGISNVGNSKLAALRSESVTNFLSQNNVPIANIEMFSSWRKNPNEWFFNRAVYLYKVDTKDNFNFFSFLKASNYD